MEIKNREKLLAIGLGACIAFWLLTAVVLKPMVQSWHDRSDRIAKLTRELGEDRDLLARGPALTDRWRNMQTNSLPPTASLAESKLFTAFDGWVRDSGVVEGSFHPQLRETDQDYSVLECRTDVTGSVQQIFNFLFNLEKDPIALKLDSIGLTSHDDNGRQLVLVLEMSGLMLPAPQP